MKQQCEWCQEDACYRVYYKGHIRFACDTGNHKMLTCNLVMVDMGLDGFEKLSIDISTRGFWY